MKEKIFLQNNKDHIQLLLLKKLLIHKRTITLNLLSMIFENQQVLSNHLYFHTPSEPPLFKGDSQVVKILK